MNSFNNKCTWTLLALVLAISAHEAAADEPKEDSDEFLRAMNGVVFAEPPSEPVGFELTEDAIETMLQMLRAAEESEREQRRKLDGPLERVKNFSQDLLDVCAPRPDKCPTVMEKIDELMQTNSQHKVNLIPYLEVCKLRNQHFCEDQTEKAETDVDESSEKEHKNFFFKLIALCSPKEKEAGKCGGNKRQ